MKKSYPYNKMSELVTCIDCNAKLKRRLVEQKQKYRRCYKCHAKYEAERGHTINFKAREKRIIQGLPVKQFS